MRSGRATAVSALAPTVRENADRRGGAPRARKRRAQCRDTKVAGLVRGPNFVRVAAHHDSQLEAVGVQGLQLLDAAARDVGGMASRATRFSADAQ